MEKNDKAQWSWLEQRLAYAIEDFKTKQAVCGNRYVVASKDHVMVEHGKGLNGTDFFCRGAGVTEIVEFFTYEAAERNLDYYLVDCNGQYIVNKPMKAYDFYAEEIALYESVLETLQKRKQAV